MAPLTELGRDSYKFAQVPRIAVVSSEPLRARTAGLGIRSLEIAACLVRHGFDVTLLSTARRDEAPATPAAVAQIVESRLAEQLEGHDAVVAQGPLASRVLAACPDLPSVIDIYDPTLIENLHCVATIGQEQFRSDHTFLWHQLARGDFFVCGSPEQRTFYLGFLAAVGRVNPERFEHDATLAELIAVAPFGVPATLGAHRAILAPRRADERRLLFGALYDWYDPFPLLEAFAAVDHPAWRLLFVRTPHPESTPQALLTEVERWCRARSLWGTRVELIDWVPAERRYDLFRDVDAVVATHSPGLESALSVRTRGIEALRAGCPVLCSAGGVVAEMVAELAHGLVLPVGTAGDLRRALETVLDRPTTIAERARIGSAMVDRLSWDRVLEPVVEFCRRPRIDWSKESFVVPGPLRRAARTSPAPAGLGRIEPCRASVVGRDPVSRLCVAVIASDDETPTDLASLDLRLPTSRGIAIEVIALAGAPRAAEIRVPPGCSLRRLEIPRRIDPGDAVDLLLRATEADLVLLVAAGASPDPGWLSALLEGRDTAPETVAAICGLTCVDRADLPVEGPGLIGLDGRPLVMRFADDRDRHLRPARDILFGSLGNLLLDRRVVLTSGGTASGLRTVSAVAADLGWRLRARGLSLRLAPQARVRVSERTASRARGRCVEDLDDSALDGLALLVRNAEPSLWKRIGPALAILSSARRDVEPRVMAAHHVPAPPSWSSRFLPPWRARPTEANPTPGGVSSDEVESVARVLRDAATWAESNTTARRVADLEIFREFPLQLVADTPADEALFANPAFVRVLPRDLPLASRGTTGRSAASFAVDEVSLDD